MKKLLNKYVEKINFKRAFIVTVFFLIMLYLIDYSVIGVAELSRITDGGDILDMEHGYSVEKAYDTFDYLGEDGRDFYLKKIIPLDFFFPIAFMMFNLSWMSMLLKRTTKQGSAVRLLTLLPFVDMLLDWSENVGFAIMLGNYPEQLETVCRVNSVITRCKLTSVMLIIIVDIVLVGVAVYKKIQKKQ